MANSVDFEKIQAKIAADKAHETEVLTRVASKVVAGLEKREWSTGMTGSCTTISHVQGEEEFYMAVNRAESFEHIANAIDPRLKFYVNERARCINVCFANKQ